MHRTPKANQDMPAHQPDIDENYIQGDNDIPIDNDVQLDPEHQNQPQNPEKGDKEKVNYHPLINGKPHIYIPNIWLINWWFI